MRWILTTALMTLLAWTVPAVSEEGFGTGVLELECWVGEIYGEGARVRLDFGTREFSLPELDPEVYRVPFLHESADNLLFMTVPPPEYDSIGGYILILLRKEDWSWQWVQVNEGPFVILEWDEGSDPVIVEEKSRFEFQEGECRRLN